MGLAKLGTVRDDGGNLLEKDIQNSIQRDITNLRRAPDNESELIATNLRAMLQRVSGASLSEIDRLMADLQSLREHLESEGARVHRELVEYAYLQQSSMQSTKVISEGLAQLKAVAERK
jgi:hypothetical protein